MIFLTGSSGFIGKSIKKNFVSNGIQIYELDLRNNESHQDKINLNSSENTLIHTAWAGVSGKDRNNDIQQENILLTKRVIKLIEPLKVSRIIAFGSQAEYGICSERITEDNKLNPQTLYANKKVECFNIFEEYYLAKNDIDLIWLRLFDTYGPMDNPNWFLPYVINSALKNRSPLLTDCSQKWDYLYIDDLVNCMKKIINSPIELNNKSISTFNLCSDNPIFLKDIVNLIFEIIKPLNAYPKFGYKNFRKNQQLYLHGNNSKIITKYKWKPEVSIKEGIIKTIDYIKENI